MRKRAAAGIIYGAEDSRNRGFQVPIDEDQTPYIAEILAALDAVRNTDTNTKLTIVSTQSIIQKSMNKKLTTWEREGWMGVRHRDALRCLAAELKARRGPTDLVVAEPGTTGRDLLRQATLLAKQAAISNRVATVDLSVPNGMALPGVSLTENRQRTFYKSICETKAKDVAVRPSTRVKLDAIREKIGESFDKHVSDEDIWMSTRNRDFLPRVTQFLWKSIHNAHKVGHYWSHIPECEERETCRECEVEESLEHILIDCQSPGREIIWRAAETIWAGKQRKWPAVSLGGVLGIGLADFCDERGRRDAGAERLYRILMSEAAYLIWKTRNDRVINRDGEPITEAEIINKWKYNIEHRRQVDMTLARRLPKDGRRTLMPQLVWDTWSGTPDLPQNWLKDPRVLVGSGVTQTIPRAQNGVG
ncbi:hypothetical protein B0H19DRAFT_1069610 [Mycena capillaripes]|nr:hypothetical protein B0H19DRAFT_1069610 [Mycena capillaripes]